MALISVIVPVYNVEKYICRCIDSILEQTFRNFELILIDDGSSDNSGRICDAYAEREERIYVVHQKNRGLSAARNAGIDWAFLNSDSQWLTFIDSDDWVHEHYLEALYTAVQSGGTEISCCRFEHTYGGMPEVDIKKISADFWDTETYFCERNSNAIIACGKMFPKMCFQSIRFPIGKLHEDEYTIYKILFMYCKLAVVDQPLYAYYVNEDSIIHKKWSPKRLEEFGALKQQKCYLKKAGLKKAMLFVVKHKIISLAVNLKKIKAEGIRTVYVPILQIALKKNLLLHNKEVRFVEENYWIYDTAFPFLMNFFWVIKGKVIKRGR